MSALVDTFDALDAAEVHRRRMLAESDALLERVEELRLAGEHTCPSDLADAVRNLVLRLGRVPADRPRGLRAAHHTVFAVQARLMAANPRHPHPRALPDRPTGVARLTVLPRGAAWKFLALPAPPPVRVAGPPDEHAGDWGRLIQLTVARALDRWACAQDQAVRAARAREPAAPLAVHRSRAAWRNYWELRCEADRILNRSREPRPAARRGRPRPPPAAGPTIEPMQPVVIGDVLWEPTPEVVRRSRLGRFMDAHGIADLAELQRRSTEDLDWFWDAVAKDLGLAFRQPYDRVVDLSEGAEWARWWRGGRMNIVESCVDRWLDGPAADRLAIVWEGEGGEVRRLTYRELHQEVCRLASALRGLGVEPGDRVGIFMPLVPETAVALLACARLGAIFLPLFSGYGATAIANRLNDGQAKVLLCADAFHRRGNVIPMKETADLALAEVPSVQHVVVLRRVGRDATPWTEGRDHDWHELTAGQPDDLEPVIGDPETPLMVIYTSGTTGRPKGAVHVHGGFPVKTAQDMAHGFDVGEGDVVFWFTDIGWMMGPWLIFGSLILGATMVLYDGTPDTPGPDRLWRMVADHRVTILGVSPTLVRGLMAAGDEHPRRHDLSSLRVLGGTGEPWNPEPFHWYFREVGGGRIPVVNYTGGTEIAGGILCGNVISRLRPCSFAGPLPGMAADVLDEQGRSVRGEVGELVIRRPWPGMTRGFWGSRERYLETYWSRFPGIWVHGDWAYVADDDLWYVLGRSDDTIKVAGKRLGPAEVESVLVGNPAVAESAAIGVPDELKGEALVCFVVLRPGHTAAGELAERLKDEVAAALGKPLRPRSVNFVPDLPRTRNAKILRRVVRSVYLGQEPGDLTALENPGALEAIEAARD
ncbi:MAG TPA: AMP-binding protein [Candidatus Dormibacteraeota bacterium]